jgi:hypothetical protein
MLGPRVRYIPAKHATAYTTICLPPSAATFPTFWHPSRRHKLQGVTYEKKVLIDTNGPSNFLSFVFFVFLEYTLELVDFVICNVEKNRQ